MGGQQQPKHVLAGAATVQAALEFMTPGTLELGTVYRGWGGGALSFGGQNSCAHYPNLEIKFHCCFARQQLVNWHGIVLSN